MPDLDTLISHYPALSVCRRDIQAACDRLLDTFRHGHKLLLCGNGGSAADCDHITGELLKGFLARRPLGREARDALAAALPDGIRHPDYPLLADGLQGSLPAISLPSMTAPVSAFANDVDPHLVFAQLVYGLGQPGDTLLCLSTSGNSRNVVLAAEVARAKGMHTLALTGEQESHLSRLCSVTVKAPARKTYRVQEYHLPIYHYLCAAVEVACFD